MLHSFILILSISFILISSQAGAYQQSSSRPNVIVILTDDQGYGDVGALGNPHIQTSELDRLHEESTRLTDFHVNPFCSPTRAALMTGRMSDRTHVRSTVYLRNHLNREETTMAEFFKASGYSTGHFGKWHLGENYPFRPIDRGFDEWVGIGDGGLGTANDYWGNDRMNDFYIRNGKWEQIEGFNTDVFFDETIKFIKENKDEPFFVYLATNVPHGPMNVQKDWREDFEGKGLKVVEKEWGDTKDLYASIKRVDDNIGKLRRFLAANGLNENTILIFLTDNGTANGAHIYNAGMRGQKGSVYDGGHRVPCFIHYPDKGINKGKDLDVFTSHTDLLPTLVDLCNLKTPNRGHLAFDGRSLANVLLNQPYQLEDRSIIMHSQNLLHTPQKGKSFVVAMSKWRLVNGNELYDIKADPGQQNNVIKQYPDVFQKLMSDYDAFWDENNGMNYPAARAVVGSPGQKETWLNTISWVKSSDSPHSWNQRHVLAGEKVSGFWPLTIEREGIYRFEVRRWPREVNIPIRASLTEQQVSDISLLGQPVKVGEGKSIAVSRVNLNVNGHNLQKTIHKTDTNAVFTMQLDKGDTNVTSTFITDDGQIYGAYYIYISRVENE